MENVEIKENTEENKEDLKTTLKKNAKGYGYQYTDIAEIHRFLEENGMKYYQEIETSPLNGQDYILTWRYINSKWEDKPKRGCKVVDAVISGVKNPAQEQGGAITYARRYSLLMAFGLATEDNDARTFVKETPKKQYNNNKTMTNRDKLVKFCKEKNIDMNTIASTYNIDKTTDEAQFAKILIAVEKTHKED